MKLIINGELRDVDDQLDTLQKLLEELKVPLARTAVEHNGAIVSQEGFSQRQLVDSDRIEIVSFVGGG